MVMRRSRSVGRGLNRNKIWRLAIVVMLFFYMVCGNLTDAFISSGIFPNVIKRAEAAGKYNENLIIALDPGHGGAENGAYYYGIKEKDANLKMANLVKKELERYDGVTVVLTRTGDETVSLSERADRAYRAKADILISLHFNAGVSGRSKGASVYISTGERYRQKLRDMADHLLGEFEALGLDNAGTFARVTQMGGRREDGTFDDYYGILRNAYNNGMPSMIIEHCYMDHEEDRLFLQSEEGFRKLAKADANGIVSYYGLTGKDGTVPEPKHAKVYGETTKGVKENSFAAPKVTGIRLMEYDGTTPGLATYEVNVEDEIGISSLYLVYKNEYGDTATITFKTPDSLKTGTYQLTGYVTEYLAIGSYTLSYIGAYNEAGYDVGYNYADGAMVGFGKCDWQNTFSYQGEANLYVQQERRISTAHAKRMDYGIFIGLRDKRNRSSMRIVSCFALQFGH